MAALLQPMKLPPCHDIVSLFDAASHCTLTSLTSGVTLSCGPGETSSCRLQLAAVAGVTVLQASTAATWLIVRHELNPIHQANRLHSTSSSITPILMMV
jgi:hypothetical protein